INNINDKINLLIAKNDHLYKQLNKINSSIQSNSLKPVVDDLQLQNQRTQESMEQLIAKVEALENSKIAIKPPNKRIKVVANVAWVVNLASTKYERSANRAADEFNQKGVPVEVIKVKVNAENWFRLRVKGFKSKQEALAYGTKVKKILNLGSVWVNRP
ncbi:MAG: SPOR domain-containing protein, partial [Methylococcales bacterium]|nr:SPOR domain-containing protein [Methylococcales bacterium]